MSALVPTLARTATALSRSPLGLIFLCLFVGEAAMLLFVSLVAVPRPEVLFLLATAAGVLPFVVVGTIYRLVSGHHTRLYAPADYRDDRVFLEVLQFAGAAQRFSQVRAIAGDDFALIAPAPAANGGMRPASGFYVLGDSAYYVTRQHRTFLLRRAGDPSGPREIRGVPAACRLIARQDCDRELHELADEVDAMESA
jgi:hypothetical protein